MAAQVKPEEFDFQISDDAFEYLAVQRGRIAKMASNRVEWTHAYKRSIFIDYGDIAPYLPERCDHILDVGSGLGGIDALLCRHYNGACGVTLLDGEQDSPVVVLHAKTFNDMNVARRFLACNGVLDISCVSPALEIACGADLVISLQSWCFHYAPSLYLDYVRECAKPRATIVIDVRKDKPLWNRSLDRMFTRTAVIRDSEKYQRVVFRA